MIIEEVEDLLENTITMLKLSLDMNFNLYWFNKKDDQNFCVGLGGVYGISCNTIIVNYLNGKKYVNINLYKPGSKQNLHFTVFNVKDISILINNYLQDIINTYTYLYNM